MASRRQLLLGAGSLLGARALSPLVGCAPGDLPLPPNTDGVLGSDTWSGTHTGSVDTGRGGDPGDNGRRFLFVFNAGGWDTTRTFARAFDNPIVDMEPDAEPATIGPIDYVAHPRRGAVDAFLEAYASELLVVNGIQVPGITHLACTRLSHTGDHTGTLPDWPTLIAHAGRDDFLLPHLVTGGTAFVGQHGRLVSRVGKGGLLPELLTGALLERSDQPVSPLALDADALVDAFLSERAQALAAGAGSTRGYRLHADLADAIDRLHQVQRLADPTVFDNGEGSFDDQGEVALAALSSGLSRCAMMHFTESRLSRYWDTHEGNDEDQSILWEELFTKLKTLREAMERAPGPGGGSLAEETVVVVFSEMGRTPAANAIGGKDHWPYTTALLMGPGLDTGRVVGGYDDYFNGERVDRDSGELDPSGEHLQIRDLGATLLELAGVDAAEQLPDAQVLPGLLRG